MTTDIHEKNWKITNHSKKRLYTTKYALLWTIQSIKKQLIYDQKGNILRYIQKPTGKTDEICQHDVDYTLAKNLKDKHIADKK